jgi:hypothetical protein
VEPVRQSHGVVREAVGLVELEHARTDARNYYAPGRGAEIDGRD